MEEFDYGIIGGGPAGYTAGMMFAKQGMSVVLFEKDKLGGTCLNRGCIPTKSFLHISNTFAQVKSASNLGINTENVTLDFSKAVEKKNQTVEKIRKSLELAVKNSGVKTVYAEACVKDKNTIIAEGAEYKVKNLILATGSKPKEIKGHCLRMNPEAVFYLLFLAALIPRYPADVWRPPPLPPWRHNQR